MPERITNFSIDKGPKVVIDEPNKLVFHYQGAKVKREAPVISSKTWSSSTKCLYFLEAGVSPPHFDVPFELWKWSIKGGFEKIASGIDRGATLTSSVDSKSVMVFNEKSNSKNVIAISLATGEKTVYTAPNNAESVEMIDHNSFLVVLHKEDEYAEVVHWNPTLTSTTRDVDVKFERPTTQLIDIAVVGNRLFGLKRTLENMVEPVELNLACSRILSIPQKDKPADVK